jgi:aubergine-like protein
MYDILHTCLRDNYSDARDRFVKEVAGAVILTGYNNKTYRIDDVDWTKNPASTFPYNGREISFIEYYREKYNLKINDPKQPLLISNPSVRKFHTSLNGIIFKLLRLISVSRCSSWSYRLAVLDP